MNKNKMTMLNSYKSLPYLVLIHSKYSSPSMMLYNTINFNRVALNSSFRIEILRVDNQAIRKNVLNSKKIEVRVVPTLLLVFPEGVIEKYESAIAFEWLQNILNNLNKTEVTLEKNKKIVEKTSMRDLDIRNDMDDEEDNILVDKMPIIKKSRGKSRREEDTPENNFPSNVVSSHHSRTKMLSEINPPNLEASMQGVEDRELPSKSKSVENQSSLMARVQEIQKEREEEENRQKNKR